MERMLYSRLSDTWVNFLEVNNWAEFRWLMADPWRAARIRAQFEVARAQEIVDRASGLEPAAALILKDRSGMRWAGFDIDCSVI